MILKFKDEIDFVAFDNLMEKYANVVYELSCLASNIINKSWGVGSFSFLFKEIRKKNPIRCFL
jgi:hypothetical protein